MKIYLISGLGADYKVLEKIKFPPHFEVVFIPWRVPNTNEDFHHYILRMSENINHQEDFCLLGYSFGGLVVQEIHKIFPAQKVIILGSIKSHLEKSKFIKLGQYTKIPQRLPLKIFNENNFHKYAFVRKLFDSKNPKILEYFAVRNPYYLKWSIEKIADWKHEEDPNVIQILGDKDLVFPIKNSHPNFVIKGGTHLFPLTKAQEVSEILYQILSF
jgi:hypothetical protein